MRALISVFDKDGIDEFALALDKLGVEIVSTGGTFKRMKELGIPAVEVTSLTHYPEIMDGRVKTLNPNIHGGILAVRHNAEHMDKVNELHIPLIDIVVVNLYPFEATSANPDSTWEDIVEKIDIGGPAMIRSAAKNHEDVIVLVNPARYGQIIEELKLKGTVPLLLKQQLAAEAYSHTAYYDSVISAYFRTKFFGANFMPSELGIAMKQKQVLRYGENSHQKAALYQSGLPAGVLDIEVLQGKELSFNNYIDMQAAYQIARDLPVPGAVVIKHTNPCGAALGSTILEAYTKAYEADPTSAFGGIIGLNDICDEGTAIAISKIFVEVIIAPDFTPEARTVFAAKANLRLIKKPNFLSKPTQFDFRRVEGGFLVQDEDTSTMSDEDYQVATKTAPSGQQWIDLKLGWAIVRYVKSNAIVLVKDGVLVGVGAGQMSRVESVELAIKRAGAQASGSTMASDAFFPFSDNVELAAAAGITAIIQPGGSVRDADSIAKANESGLSMVFTGRRHFRH